MTMGRQDFDSGEEWQVFNWLQEAVAYGLVRDVVYQPKPFELAPRASVEVLKQMKTKTKKVDEFLFHPHKYTPDFSFSCAYGYFSCAFRAIRVGLYQPNVIIDVKGGFNRFGDPKQFSINQKWVWDKFGIYVEKVVPEKLFKKTWVPSVCRLTPKKRQPVKKYIGVPTIDEFLEKNNRITEHQTEMF